ncbi:MAG TPA: methyltransferase domain-containing protein [Anaerolineaceae bacterium]
MEQIPNNPNSSYHEVPLACDLNEVKARHAANRAGWNQAAIQYHAEIQETIAFLQSGKSSLHPIERANLGSLKGWCGRAVHLQCASGRDTLSLWIEGAGEVVGVDISDLHIENACTTSAALHAPAVWYCCDVLETPHELDNTADLVYTGRGALCWLHDIDGWAKVVARLLKPGGIFHILDDHPVTWLFDMDSETLVASGINYFAYAEASRGWGGDYLQELDIPLSQMATKYERLWTLGMIFNALTQAGLRIDLLDEYPDPYWGNFANLRPEFRGRIPLTFAIKAHKPKE